MINRYQRFTHRKKSTLLVNRNLKTTIRRFSVYFMFGLFGFRRSFFLILKEFNVAR